MYDNVIEKFFFFLIVLFDINVGCEHRYRFKQRPK